MSLAHPDLRGDRTDNQIGMAFKRVLRLIVQRLELQRIDRETFCVAMTLYSLGSLLEESCQIVPGGSECELNTPAQFVIAPNNFEDCGGHQTPFAPPSVRADYSTGRDRRAVERLERR